MVVTSGGATTIGIGFAARSVPRPQGAAPLRTVLRVFDKDLSRRIRREIPDSVGLSSSFLGAPWFAAAMIGQEVKATVPYLNRVLVLAEIEVVAGSGLVGQYPESLGVPGECRLLAIRTATQASGGGGVTIEPAVGRDLHPHDTIVVIATTAGLSRLRMRARTQPLPRR